MNIRDARSAAITRRYRDLTDNFSRMLPLLLDDLDAIDEAHNMSELPRTGAEAAEWAWPAQPPVAVPTDAQIEAWAARNPQAIAALMAKNAAWARGGDAQVVLGAPASKPPMTSLPPAAPVKPAPARPATRRRAARKDGAS